MMFSFWLVHMCKLSYHLFWVILAVSLIDIIYTNVS